MPFNCAAAQAQIAGNIAYAPTAVLSWSPPGGGAALTLPAMIVTAPADAANRIDPNPGDDVRVLVTIARSLFGHGALPRQNQEFTAAGTRYRIAAAPGCPGSHTVVFTCVVT